MIILLLAFTLIVLIILSQQGPIILYLLILPVTVLTNFDNTNLSDVFMLHNYREAYLLLFSLAFYYYGLRNRTYFKGNDLIKRYGLYVVFLSVTIIFSTNMKLSTAFFISTYLFTGLIMLIGMNLLKEENNRRHFEKTILGLLIIVLIFAAYQYLSQSLGFGSDRRNPDMIVLLTAFESLRTPSFFATSYMNAEFYYFIFPFLLNTTMQITRKKKLGYILLLSFLIIGTIWTQQRSGLAIIILQIILVSILNQKSNGISSFIRKSAMKLIITAFIGLIALYSIYQSDVGRELLDRTVGSMTLNVENIDDSGSAFYRVLRIMIATNIFLDFPLAGSGLGTSFDIYPSYGWNIKEYDGGAHNLLFYILSETGLIGLVGFLVFFSFIIQFIYRRYSSSKNMKDIGFYSAALTFLITVLLDGLFSGMLVYPSILFIAIAISYIFTYKPEAREYRMADAFHGV